MPEQTTSRDFRAVVVGGTGYGGAELIRLLAAHPHVSLARVTSIDHVDEPLESVHLNLTDSGLRFEEIPLPAAAEGADVVFLGLPHKVSATFAPDLAQVAAKIVDLSGDFRLRDAQQYAAFYGGEHPHPAELEGGWTYGLPELNRDAIREARRVASPGCFATSIILGLLPLAHAGLLRGAVQTVACTGSSGSGAYAKPGTHHPLRANNLKGYKPLSHQHTPEISQALRDGAAAGGKSADFQLNFVPVSAPLTRGILANTFASIPAEVGREQIQEIYRSYYADAAFVRVLGAGGRQSEVVAVKGSMWVDLSLNVGEPADGTRQLLVSTAIDNLVKGGAGQAVQSMNLMLGLPERAGIDAPALWP
ncbi:MAG: N-acetyl-gamma-glutamyl-phosphate reductase [Myxococcales bacterium FL481]|nr:MAG: N-acetyl-gamma-glutamyl-phosphate reductase [Myxococcales bacterium FL481]